MITFATVGVGKQLRSVSDEMQQENRLEAEIEKKLSAEIDDDVGQILTEKS